MIKAVKKDKARVVHILTESFNDNQSINYILRQDSGRFKSLQVLLSYSFDICLNFGEVYLSNDYNACALVLLPEQKKTNLYSICLDIKLAFACIGLRNIPKILQRENAIKKLQPVGLLYYLWFIGVDPQQQGKGIGSRLLNELIEQRKIMGRIICLETSTLKNIPWYEKHGFEIYAKKDFGYSLYFLKQ